MSVPMAGGSGRRGRLVDLPFADLIDTQIRNGGLTNSQVAKGIRRRSHSTDHQHEGATETTAETVSRWRNGHHMPGPYHLRLIAEYFELSFTDVIRLVQAQQATLVAGRIDPDTSQPVGGLGLPAIDSESVKRRQFIKLGAVGLASVAAGLDLEQATAAWTSAKVDAESLDVLAAMTDRLMRQETSSAPEDLLPAVNHHLNGFRDVFFWTPGDLAPRVYALAGETALLAGFLAFKLNRRTAADIYWSHAGRFAEAAGHKRLQAGLLALQSWRWDDEDPLRSMAQLDRATALLGPHPDPAVAALVAGWRGSTWRNTGVEVNNETSRTALIDLENAERHLSRLDRGDTDLYVIEDLRGEVTHSRALCLAWLNRFDEAVGVFEGMLRSIRDPSPSWRSCIMADLGVAYAGLGQPEQASEMLGAALRLSAEAGSPYRVQMVRVAYQRHLAGYDSPAVRSFAEQLQLT
jgi:tetratricopeptide (TPR) repeat protein